MSFWSEAQLVKVRLGMSSVDLGLQVLFEVLFDKEYWLSIQFEGEPKLTERISISLAGFEKHEEVLQLNKAGVTNN